MRFAAVFAASGCALFAVCLVGCTALLDTDSLSNGHGASGIGGVGGLDAGNSGGADSDAGAGDSAGSPPAAAGSNATGGSGGSAQGGSAGNAASGGDANISGGGSTGMAGAGAGGASAGGASAGAGGAPCVKSGKEVCDGVDNDCNPATPDCPTGCTLFSAYSVNYMACDKLDNWDNAEVACLEQNMQLTPILSAAENVAITAKLKQLMLGPQVWIGGQSDLSSNTTYEWTAGDVIYKNGKAVAGVYQNWASNQPATLSGPSDLQINASAGTWSNALPSTNQTFVCKARAP